MTEQVGEAELMAAFAAGQFLECGDGVPAGRGRSIAKAVLQ